MALGVTTRTNETHLTRLYERFDVASRAELVRTGAAGGLA